MWVDGPNLASVSDPLLMPSSPPSNKYEAQVWRALRDQLGERDLIISNQIRYTRERTFEIDLVVGLDGYGVVVLEVKGGHVFYEGGSWRQTTPDGEKRIDPFGQASRGMYALRQWVEESAAWGSRRRVRWTHAVVFPSVEVPAGYQAPDSTRWQIVDKDDLTDIAGKLRTLLQTRDDNDLPLDLDATSGVIDAIRARNAPQRDAARTIELAVEENEERVERLSAEQARILDALALLDRVEVRGGAGSGKTWLAVEQARRLARDGQRVALLAYSRGLAAWMQRRFDAGVPDSERPAYIGTFHGLGEPWGALDDARDDVDYWEEELPELMVEKALAQPMSELYDAIVIDEAQDFADAWWPAVMAALKYEDSPLYVFSDEGQRVFARFGEFPAGLVPVLLDRNLRNTKQISRTFTTMAPNRLRESDWEGPEVRFHACSLEDAISVADDAVDALLDEGWQPSDVCLLTTGSRHPEQKSRVELEGRDAYWDSFWDADQVFYSTVLGFKGLERPAVVLAVNDSSLERDRERLYVGLSRARDLLVVCGDPDYIRRVAGPEVLAALGG